MKIKIYHENKNFFTQKIKHLYSLFAKIGLETIKSLQQLENNFYSF